MRLSEYTMPEVRHYLAECNFTKDELLAFQLLTEGCTIEQVAELMDYSESTIKRIKNHITTKIKRLENL